jgi:AmmeMemoRadiSam system protein A
VLAAVRKLGISAGTILKHATSADSPYGDNARTVGYCAVAFAKPREASKEASAQVSEAAGEPLSKGQQKELLSLSRRAIERFLDKGERPGANLAVYANDPAMAKSAAVFVTLKKEGELRGCIGAVKPDFPLFHAVQHYALAAAFQDPRFPGLKRDELGKISLEISVLSEPRRIESADEITPFRDGVIVSREGQGGLFLPQVWEHVAGDKEQFMNLLCSEKAGLPENCWKNPSTQLSTFQVFSFSERE